MPLGDLVVAHSDGKRPARAYQHDQLPRPGDRGVQDWPGEHHVMRGHHGDHDGPVFASLGLVDADRIGQGQLIRLAPIVAHLAVVDLHAQRLVGDVDRPDPPQVAVKDVEVIVVAQLDHPVARPERAPAEPTLRLAGRGRIEGRLQPLVQVAHPYRAPIHRAEHLDVLHRVIAEPARDAVLDNVDHQVGRCVGIVLHKEVEIGRCLGKGGHLPLVDPVSVGHDQAVLGLSVDEVELHDGHGAGIDHIAQHIARAHAGKLIDIADQEKVRRWVHRLEQVVGQQQVEHAGLVHDEHIHVQRILVIVLEPLPRNKAQQPVNGLRRASGGLGQPLGGPTGRRGKGISALEPLQDFDDRAHGRRLARARAAGQDCHLAPGSQGCAHGLLLPFRKLLVLAGIGKEHLPHHPVVDGQPALTVHQQLLQAPSDTDLAIVERSEVHGLRLTDRTLGAARPGHRIGDRFSMDLLFPFQRVYALLHQIDRHLEHRGRCGHQLLLGCIDVPLIRHLAQGIGDARRHASGRVKWQPQVSSDLIGGLEPDAVDLAGQAVGILLHDLYGSIPKRLVDLDRPRGAHAMPL